MSDKRDVPMTAYSTKTNTTYPSWEDLLAAESNGYVVIATSERPTAAPYAVGPFPTQKEARQRAAVIRRKEKAREAPYKVRAFVRVLWKEGQ